MMISQEICRFLMLPKISYILAVKANFSYKINLEFIKVERMCNMPFKPRTEPPKLRIMRSLNSRMDLTEVEKKYYLNLEKGYQGELMFDSMTENLHSGYLTLNDLCLETNNSEFQIDTLLISQDKIFPFEVKNYEGDFYYHFEKLYHISGEEVKDPLIQIRKNDTLLRQFLRSLGCNFPIESWVVFINPEFTLYEALKNMPIIFPTQLKRFLKKLNTTPSKLTNRHTKLADQLVSAHIKDSPFTRTRLPAYNYGQLRKGVLCPKCNSYMFASGERKLVCGECGLVEEMKSAVLRNVEEIKLLFPDIKITTNLIHEWCEVIGSKKMIGRILRQNWRANGYGQWTFYE
jgi:ribosomal protein S27AE